MSNQSREIRVESFGSVKKLIKFLYFLKNNSVAKGLNKSTKTHTDVTLLTIKNRRFLISMKCCIDNFEKTVVILLIDP